ncbi:sulfite oxidase-like oxidoreductase [Thermoplasma sp.]|uniref:sulfite oxidase-like oxidoreductase n=1 Tax=Thermoplasma sp. TaxID=1973142 RepID=UPI0025E97500|nr:sulfite oxidase-like oxidoreductase [Thermoplasma sp.]
MDRVEVKNPGQRYISNFIIYDALGEPEIDLNRWRLCVDGLVKEKRCYSFDDLESMPHITYTADFNCVTKWSIKDVVWEGPSLSELIGRSVPDQKASWVMFWSADGYSTPVPLEYALSDKALVAIRVNGASLKKENGFPARPFIPDLYGWKSAKWLTLIELIDDYRDGYWEQYGYHEIGRVENEERFKGFTWKSIRRNSRRSD